VASTLTTLVQNKTASYTVTVKYSTFNTLLDPCAFLQTTLAESVVKDMGLTSGTLSDCLLLNLAFVNSQNVYTWEVTVTV
jgi:hypothetical protein